MCAWDEPYPQNVAVYLKTSLRRGGFRVRLLTDFFFLVLFFVLLIVWLVAWAAMHVAGGFVHLIIVIAVISLIIHFVRGRTA